MDQWADSNPVTIGPYRIETRIAQTKTAWIYVAEDASGRIAAIKAMNMLGQTGQQLERFKREIALAQDLHDDHIVPIIDYGEDRGILWAAMPYYPLGTLAQRIQPYVAWPLPAACALVIQIAGALHVAHTHRPPAVHRDVKPSNILFSDARTALLTDFGIAQIAGLGHLTQSNSTVGTPSYMSPEQVEGEKNLDERSDIYALGCVLYELVTGRPPFVEDSQLVVLQHHLHYTPASVDSLERNPRLNRGIALVVEQSLAKDPNDRFRSAHAFALALHPFAEVFDQQQDIFPTILVGDETSWEKPTIRRIPQIPN